MGADKERVPSPRKGKRRILAHVLFAVYFVLLFYLLFFSEEMGRTYSEKTYHYNLVPLREIMRFVKYRRALGWRAVALNIWGNILAFVPFGLFLPLYTARCRKIWYTVFYSFELSLVVEMLQLVTKVGSFDVDDLILNTLGGLLGYAAYRAVMKLWRKRYEAKKTQKKGL